jgi:hypothetical protein
MPKRSCDSEPSDHLVYDSPIKKMQVQKTTEMKAKRSSKENTSDGLVAIRDKWERCEIVTKCESHEEHFAIETKE